MVARKTLRVLAPLSGFPRWSYGKHIKVGVLAPLSGFSRWSYGRHIKVRVLATLPGFPRWKDTRGTISPIWIPLMVVRKTLGYYLPYLDSHDGTTSGVLSPLLWILQMGRHHDSHHESVVARTHTKLLEQDRTRQKYLFLSHATKCFIIPTEMGEVLNERAHIRSFIHP